MSNLSVYEALDYLSPELRDSAFNYLTKLPEEFAKLEGRFDELQNSNPQCSFPLLLLSMAIASSRAAHARDVAQYTIEDLPESKKLIEDIREYTKRPRTTASQESKISRSLVTCFNAQLGIDVTFGD
ncbi:MAG: hypothetical protein EBX50_23385, partial [Chitinophagia bacterium]|nr:hypothetical protein [Chitinophagia bacterium]